jgi:hypothetical protein
VVEATKSLAKHGRSITSMERESLTEVLNEGSNENSAG